MRARRGRLLTAIAVGGAVGTLARAGLVEAVPFEGDSWPWATFAANVAGTFVLAFLLTREERLRPSAYRRPLVGVGFCGALTTFSTFQVELIELADAGRPGLAVAYAAASLAAGLALAFLTTKATRRMQTP